jgi:maleate isomerase
MANPTVEAEMRKLLPSALQWVTGRLVSDVTDSMARLIAYAETLPVQLRQFDSLPLEAVAFGCTGSSYLIDPERQAQIAAALPCPMIWATDAIAGKLAALGAKGIAVISPYPPVLHAAGLKHWARAGFDVVFSARVEIGTSDTRAIYALTSDAARGALSQALAAQPDVVLLSGTGMPTLDLVDPAGNPPVVSSNLCLAEAIARHAGDFA